MANLRTQVIQDNAMPVVMLGFTGAYQDPVTAFYPLGNGYRWYLPGLMRFNAPDSFSPFGAGGPNPYAYCGDDPINHTDPTGHMFRSATQIAEEEAALASESLAAKTARATEAGTSSAVPSKYVLFQDFVYPAYKNLQGVERKQLELGTATVTVHFTDIPPEEVRKSGGISPPNPKNKNQTLAFGNRMYAGDRESPYVISYKTNPGQRAMEGGSKKFKYVLVSQPSDFSLDNLGFVPVDYGSNRQVLRLGKVPLTDIMAGYDLQFEIAKVYTFPEFKNTHGVPIPSEIQTYGTSLPQPQTDDTSFSVRF